MGFNEIHIMYVHEEFSPVKPVLGTINVSVDVGFE